MEDGNGLARPMLAERRQKVRYILNPSQTSWTKDSSRFGLKYMEKLGWKSGQGIGANLQGLTDNIKVSVRSDNRGLGFKGVPEDVLPHQNNFSDLLAQLATTTPPVTTEAEEENKSLEVKSRQSRSRVHYSKFTRSKDVSRYSGNDLSCILGKPAKPSESYIEDYVHSEPSFIQRGNMQSYFKTKLKTNNVDFVADNEANKLGDEDNLCMGFGFNQVNKDIPLSHVSVLCPGSETTDNQYELNRCINISRKCCKTNNKNIEEINSNLFLGVNCTGSFEPIENGQDSIEGSKMTSRKRKRNSMSPDFAENSCPVSSNCEIDLPVHNKDIKRSKNNRCVEVPATESCLTLTDNWEATLTDGKSNESTKKSKRKRKKEGLCLEVPAIESCLPITDCSKAALTIETEQEFNDIKKKKKKQKKNAQCLEVPANESGLPITDSSEAVLTMETEEAFNENIKKKRKKQKKNDQCLEVPANESCLPIAYSSEAVLTIETEQEFNDIKKKKKKQKKNDQCLEVPANESCLPITDSSEAVLTMETEETFNENIKKKKKKQNKNAQCLEVSANESCLPITDSSEAVLTIETEEVLNENIKKKRKKQKQNDQCLEVPANESCLPIANSSEAVLTIKSGEAFNENINKSKKKTKGTKDNLCMDHSNSEILDNHLIENPAPDRRVPIQVATPIMEIDGVKYTNGIAHFNKYLKRRQTYSHNTLKHFPLDVRERAVEIFDQFPGSNITLLPGYAVVGQFDMLIEGTDQSKGLKEGIDLDEDSSSPGIN